MTPFKIADLPYQRRYNYKHSATRMSIEKCYGQLKRRFPKLKHGLEFRKPSDCANCIVATVVVYNVCKRNFDEDFEVDLIDADDLTEPVHNISQNFNSIEKRESIARHL